MNACRIMTALLPPLCRVALGVAGVALAQEAPTTVDSAMNDASIKGLKNARVISLSIPAPRGQILDREGEPLAQNRVSYQVALQFPQFENATQEFVVSWARKRLGELKVVMPKSWDKTDEELWAHYKDRRWLPFYLSGFLSSAGAAELSKKLGERDDLILMPVYSRYYPGATLAAHIIGYTGSAGKLPTGPINFNDPLWEFTEGKSGLELLYDKQLSGTPGMKRMLYNNDGVKLQEEIMRRPIAGGNIVTTINKRWQERAESVLKNGCQRGAFVVLDVTTGEVLVMASRPSFDLMEFIGGISTTRFKELNEDPAAPLFARAFAAQYPPASTFKAVVGLAALHAGTIKENTPIYSPAFLQFPGHKVRNASGREEGNIAVKYAMARSCNTWFAQVGINTGSNNFLAMARDLGYGEKSGLPLVGEASGLIPTNEWMIANHKRRFMNGDSANMSIGQGVLLATPLQVAQGMAGIGNGQVLPKLQLIRQVQDGRGRVMVQSLPEVRTNLGVKKEAVQAIHKGMRDVVHEGYGTGRSARLSWTTMCGKTGTAQWGPPSKNQRLAWFAGYFPYDNPRFAYAVVYEGRPGQVVSGGRMAAPMVQAFFNPLRKEIEEIISPPKRALVIDDDGGSSLPSSDGIPRAIPVDDDDWGGIRKALPVPEDDQESSEEDKEQTPEADDVPLVALPVPDEVMEEEDQPEEEIRRAIPIDEDAEETGDEIEFTPE
jgi:penicillin-binding protein 2